MQALIGNTLIKQTRPGPKPFEIRDTRLKGFLLRVQPSGVMSYYAEYGRAKRMRIGRTDAMGPEKARERAKAILAEAYAGGDPMQVKRDAQSHTFETFVDEVYAPWAEGNLRTAKATVARLKRTFPDLQQKNLFEISSWLVEKWRMARLKAGVKPSTINRDLGDLKSSLAKAVEWGLLPSHPLATVKASKVDNAAKPRFLSTNEEKRLREALEIRDTNLAAERASANLWRAERGYPLLPEIRGDHLRPMVLLALNTGLRRGELFNLKWSDIDFERANLTVRGSGAKSGKTRHVPLNRMAQESLQYWRSRTMLDKEKLSSALVFPGKDGKRLNNVRTAWGNVLKAAKIKGFRWHDMRHHFASRLVMQGVDLNTVRELLGHSDYKMTLRYSHLAPEHKAAAVARLMGD